jgi:hypothetical protein
MRTEKSGGTIEVAIPILPILQRPLDAGPTSDLAFICGARGGPLTKETFGNSFVEAARAAGVNGKSAHGLRKIDAMRCAYNGATIPQMNASFGWTGTQMALPYIQEAERAQLAAGAIAMILPAPSANDVGTSIPSPDEKVRDQG